MDWLHPEKFEGLEELAALAEERGHPLYAEYCRLRERAARTDALKALAGFIEVMAKESVPKRREFVDWLLKFCFENPGNFLACPVLLRAELVEPTVCEWLAAEPENPQALRWSRDPRAILLAARTLPPDKTAIGRFTVVVLEQVAFNCHELPAFYSGPSVAEDLANVQTALDLLNRVPDAEFFQEYREEALVLKVALVKEAKKKA